MCLLKVRGHPASESSRDSTFSKKLEHISESFVELLKIIIVLDLLLIFGFSQRSRYFLVLVYFASVREYY